MVGSLLPSSPASGPVYLPDAVPQLGWEGLFSGLAMLLCGWACWCSSAVFTHRLTLCVRRRIPKTLCPLHSTRKAKVSPCTLHAPVYLAESLVHLGLELWFVPETRLWSASTVDPCAPWCESVEALLSRPRAWFMATFKAAGRRMANETALGGKHLSCPSRAFRRSHQAWSG
jgi:hypothetical protein